MPLLSRHKTLLLLLSPFLFGAIFFLASSVSTLVRIQRAKIPKNFERVNFKVKSYEIVEIDPNTNKVKWSLNAESAQTDINKSTAKVKKPIIHLFNASSEYLITADSALLNRAKKEIDLYENVSLNNADGQFSVKAGSLKFADKAQEIIVEHAWSLESKSDYKISGEQGHIRKDFKALVSKGNARLEKSNLDLRAETINLDSESPVAVVAEGKASLRLSADKTLNAEKIIIHKDGKVNASGAVKVVSKDMICFSERMDISPNADKSPQLAVFSGNPHLLRNKNMVYADSIHYDFQTQKAIIEGNVHSNNEIN